MVTEKRIRELIREERIREIAREELKQPIAKEANWEDKVHVLWVYTIMLVIVNILGYFGELITGIKVMTAVAILDIVFGIVCLGLAYVETIKLYNKHLVKQ